VSLLIPSGIGRTDVVAQVGDLDSDELVPPVVGH
jgi:ATP-dependent protease Clp ATPase subunit